jgi:uncharacterized protein YjbJ (UPF0337 family)
VGLVYLTAFNIHLGFYQFIENLKFINMKNLTELKGNWNEQKGKLKQKYAVLTDNDFVFLDGKKDEMLGRLQIKLGKTKDQLRKIIEEL